VGERVEDRGYKPRRLTRGFLGESMQCLAQGIDFESDSGKVPRCGCACLSEDSH